jgi:glycosyltransferase involved in cell wall biosynthesis
VKIIQLHNYYQQAGGEDDAFAAEGRLLEAHGHEVVRHCVHNDAIDGMSRLRVAGATLWNRESYWRLRALFRAETPQVAHFHNTFPLISPAAYYAARAEGVPVVQTLHNFRLLCPNALLYRDGHVCRDCVGRAVPWPAVVHRCYRGSRSASAVTAGMLSLHRLLGTWQHAVSTYIVLTAFAREMVIAGGLPPDRIVVKPNALSEDPGRGEHAGDYALFVGRLSAEKGLDLLLQAWRQLRRPYKLVIAGSGPLDTLSQGAPPHITWLGHQPKARIFELMREAAFLVFPSSVYEGFPMTLVQALATGLPVIASGHGSMAEIIRDGVTGYHFTPGDASDLAARVEWAFANRDELRRLGGGGRDEFLSTYTAERNYATLAAAYQATRERSLPRARAGGPAGMTTRVSGAATAVSADHPR